jgi:hypothetical protein
MAEYAINITEQDILNAAAYIDIGVKEEFTRAVAFACLEPVEVQNDGESLPTMFRENKKIKAQYLMGTLAILLQKPFEPQKLKSGEELSGCMSEADYNLWASSHVMNQLERLKKGKQGEVVNKLFDLLYDYKAIEMMLTGAIKDELEVRNDPFNRAMQFFSNSALQAAMDSMVDGELRKALDERKGEADG